MCVAFPLILQTVCEFCWGHAQSEDGAFTCHVGVTSNGECRAPTLGVESYQIWGTEPEQTKLSDN